MRKPGGYWVCYDPDPRGGNASTTEFDTTSCAHCSRITRVKSGVDPAESSPLCRQCGEYICQQCAGKKTCTPMEAVLDEMERIDSVLNGFNVRDAWHRAYEKVAR